MLGGYNRVKFLRKRLDKGGVPEVDKFASNLCAGTSGSNEPPISHEELIFKRNASLLLRKNADSLEALDQLIPMHTQGVFVRQDFAFAAHLD